jgi:hypothetical protein
MKLAELEKRRKGNPVIAKIARLALNLSNEPFC